MTETERVFSVLNKNTPDRTPIFEYVLLNPLASVFAGREYLDGDGVSHEHAKEQGLKKAVRRYAQDRAKISYVLGHDMMYVVPNPVLQRAQKLSYPDYNGGCDWSDPVSIIETRNKYFRFGIEHEVFDEQAMLTYEYIREELAVYGLDLPFFAPAYSHGIGVDTDLMQAMALAPEITAENFRLRTEMAKKNIDAYIGHGIKIIGVGGDFAGNRPLISPEMYRGQIMPEVKKTSDYIHSKGGYAVNASDGDLWSVIDDFLIGCGVDAYMEIDRRAGMELAELIGRFGKKVTFFGDMDCGNTLSFSSPEEIRNDTVRCLDEGRAASHIFTPGNAITSSIPLENYLAMVEAYREYWGLGKINMKF
ncbi:MAG: hypothetical protein FWD23_08895 [Oscillospiraceae bacterium]|nr:hypothetical protein [Oscillospiraceae bacterium]